MTGADVKKFREKHDFNQAELAELVGVKTGTVTKWETGARNVGQSAQKIMEAYDASPVDFTNETKKDPPLSMEDLLAGKLMDRLLPIINKVLESHQKIIAELINQGLDIDDLKEDVSELKDMCNHISKDVKQLH